jgi:YgiT-type zinc finger domain-containing protein
MTCPICHHGQTVNGLITLVFLKGSFTIIVKNVPGEICNHCDESFLFEDVSKKVIDLTCNEQGGGTSVKMLHYTKNDNAA